MTSNLYGVPHALYYQYITHYINESTLTTRFPGHFEFVLDTTFYYHQ